MASSPHPSPEVPAITLYSSPPTLPSFTCTICWQLQPPGSSPKVLGKSARIVCEPCWRAVLDLSICWVCGECIVRGDEVVSLGWCFWHRSCFGCLVCGTAMDVPGVVSGGGGDEELNSSPSEENKMLGSPDKNGGVEGDSRRRSRIGVELEEIPLCGVCAVDTIGESEEHVLEKGLDNVTKFDGGLSKDRLQRLSEAGDEEEHGRKLASKLSTKLFRRLKRSSKMEDSAKALTKCRASCHSNEALNGEGLTPTLANTADVRAPRTAVTRISEDGSIEQADGGVFNISEEISPHPEPAHEDTTSIVYVSVTDPICGGSFRPSKTKPLPKWMNLLPNNVHRDRERSQEPEAEPMEESKRLRANNQSYSSDGTEDTAAGGEETPSNRKPAEMTEHPRPDTRNPEVPPRPSLKARTTIAFDTTPEGDIPQDDIAKSFRRTRTAQSSYMTAVDTFDPPTRQSTFRRSPYPSGCRKALKCKEGSSYFSPRSSITSLAASSDDSASTITPPAPSQNSAGTRTPVPDCLNTIGLKSNHSFSSLASSEYLDRYKPESPVAKYEKYVAGESQPVLSKIKKRKEEEQEQEQGGSDAKRQKHDMKGTAKISSPPNEEFGNDPRRDDLNKELRNLFCEE